MTMRMNENICFDIFTGNRLASLTPIRENNILVLIIPKNACQWITPVCHILVVEEWSWLKIKKPVTAATEIGKPQAAEVPIARCIDCFAIIKYGTISDPPPIPTRADIQPARMPNSESLFLFKNVSLAGGKIGSHILMATKKT